MLLVEGGLDLAQNNAAWAIVQRQASLVLSEPGVVDLMMHLVLLEVLGSCRRCDDLGQEEHAVGALSRCRVMLLSSRRAIHLCVDMQVVLDFELWTADVLAL